MRTMPFAVPRAPDQCRLKLCQKPLQPPIKVVPEVAADATDVMIVAIAMVGINVRIIIWGIFLVYVVGNRSPKHSRERFGLR